MITQFPSKEYDISRLISKSRLPEDYIAYCKKAFARSLPNNVIIEESNNVVSAMIDNRELRFTIVDVSKDACFRTPAANAFTAYNNRADQYMYGCTDAVIYEIRALEDDNMVNLPQAFKTSTINKCTVVPYADNQGYAPGKHSLLKVGSNIQQSVESVMQWFSYGDI